VEKSVAIRILNREDLRPGQFGLSGRVAQDFAGFLASFWGAALRLPCATVSFERAKGHGEFNLQFTSAKMPPLLHVC
jgi:hypothetical protein